MSARPRGADSREQTTLTLSKAHLAPNRTMSAKQMIFQAVTMLESDNEELKQHNANIMNELKDLKKENEQLRKELEISRQRNEEVDERFCTLDKENKKLVDNLQNQIIFFQQEAQKISQAEVKLAEENGRCKKQVDLLKGQLFHKDTELKSLSKDLESLEKQIEKNANRNISDRDFELMHEMESLKTERKELIHDREEQAKTASKLRNEFKNLEVQLEEKVAELKNENRRHSLLTKEFNSLLEENNHLKLQLRRRNQRHSIAANGLSRDDSSSTVSLSLSESNPLRVPRKHNSYSNLNLTRDSSLVVPDDRSMQRDSSLNSRERLLSRDTTTTTASTRDSDSSFYTQPHSSSRDLAAGGKRMSREIERTNIEYAPSTSPDTLPLIPGSTKTGTWKP